MGEGQDHACCMMAGSVLVDDVHHGTAGCDVGGGDGCWRAETRRHLHRAIGQRDDERGPLQSGDDLAIDERGGVGGYARHDVQLQDLQKESFYLYDT